MKTWTTSGSQFSTVKLIGNRNYITSWAGPDVTSGVSASAKLIQEFINVMNAERTRWQESMLLNTPNNIEKEVIVFLPPQQSKTVKLHIKKINYPNPLISLED
jgi:hypothetical protein